MINVEKSAIVVDVGTRYLKCGLSGERSPRAVIRWEVAEMVLKSPPLSKTDWINYVGNQLYEVCFKHLRVAPKNRRLVICEDLLFPRNLREAIADVVFNVLKAKQLLLLPSMTTALYATCQNTALIVDSGWHETRILPVIDRIPLIYAYTTTALASRSSCAIISQDFPQVDSPEDVFERACFAISKKSDVAAKDAHFFTHTPLAVTIPAKKRSDIVEALFLGDDSYNSIPDAIQACLAKCPVDTRNVLLKNILCIGGTSMIPGFLGKLEESIPHATVLTTYFPGHLMTWIGASIYGSTEEALAFSQTAESYAEKPHVEDWMELP